MARLRRGVGHRRAPAALLALLCLVAVGARAWHLGTPKAGPHGGYVFDERYYVAAARVILGRTPGVDALYAHAAPAGTDPNGEHPQLGKLVIAAGIALFGDTATAFRSTAVLFSLLALLMLYWLVRCAGGGPWLSLGATALGAVDNLWLVSGRIAVLDIYLLPFMLAGVALYLRRRPLLAGAVIGLGCCMKEFGLYALGVTLALELISAAVDRRGTAEHESVGRRVRRWTSSTGVAILVFLALLSALDTVITPYSDGRPVDRGQAGFCSALLVLEDGCNHLVFMSRYAQRLRGEGGPTGIAAAPTAFWIDQKPIPYYVVARITHPHGRRVATKIIDYRGEINRVLLFTAWLALALCGYWAVRERDRLSILALAWALGTWLPLELTVLLSDRTTYLFYMVVVMPALYVAVARLLSARRIPRWLLVPWVVALMVDFAVLYPFRTFSGH